MADQKISELNALTGVNAADDDALAIVDTSATETKKITRAQLFTDTPSIDVSGNITVSGTVDGRDLATDGTKLDGIEASADVTDATNVTAAGALMDSEVANLAQVKAFDSSDYATAAQGTTADAALPKAGGVVTGDVTFGDNDKAIFGAGSDLQIYHNGSHSYIQDVGTGRLYITTNGDEIRLTPQGGGENGLRVQQDGAVNLYYDNGEKFATTSTGVDITGTITSDGLTVDGTSGTPTIRVYANYTTGANTAIELMRGTSGTFGGDAYTDWKITTDSSANYNIVSHDTTYGENTRFSIGLTGDISFYEDTGTTEKFFWDASAEGLNLGASSAPFGKLDVSDVGGSGISTIFDAGANGDNYFTSGTSGVQVFRRGASEAMRIDSSGNVGIGTSSPTSVIDVRGEAVFGSGTDGVKLTYSAGNSTGIIDTGFTSTGLEFRTGNSFAAIIDSSGNVGVGTTNPIADLSIVDSSTGSGIEIQPEVTTDTNRITNYDRVESAYKKFRLDASEQQFYISGSEKMRLDSSGNLLVNQTDTSDYTDTVGSSFRATGFSTHTCDDNAALLLNRLSEDGEILLFRKDNATVGSIGNRSVNLEISSPRNIEFNADTSDANRTIYFDGDHFGPFLADDASVDFGMSNRRWKDLYLSGDVYLGGTVDGRDVSADGDKLDGIETGATADQTASEILTAIKTVDGSGSGLDADTVDGIQASSFLRSDADDSTSSTITFSNDIVVGDQIIHDGDTDTYMQFHNTNEWRVVTGGTERLEVTDSALTSAVNVEAPLLHSTGGTFASGVDTSTTAGLVLESGDQILGHGSNSHLRNLLKWTSASTIDIGQGGTSLISGITLEAGTSGVVTMKSGLKLDHEVTETVTALSGTSDVLEPQEGTIRTHTLSGNTTYTESFSAGQSMTLMINDGSGYTVTWPTITWVNNGGSAPTLATSGYTVIVLWKVSTTLYGALVGDGS